MSLFQSSVTPKLVKWSRALLVHNFSCIPQSRNQNDVWQQQRKCVRNCKPNCSVIVRVSKRHLWAVQQAGMSWTPLFFSQLLASVEYADLIVPQRYLITTCPMVRKCTAQPLILRHRTVTLLTATADNPHLKLLGCTAMPWMCMCATCICASTYPVIPCGTFDI